MPQILLNKWHLLNPCKKVVKNDHLLFDKLTRVRGEAGNTSPQREPLLSWRCVWVPLCAWFLHNLLKHPKIHYRTSPDSFKIPIPSKKNHGIRSGIICAYTIVTFFIQKTATWQFFVILSDLFEYGENFLPVVGGFNQPLWKICSSQSGSNFPRVRDEN